MNMQKISGFALLTALLLSGGGLGAQSIVHPKKGASFSSDKIKVTFIDRKQQFNYRERL